MLKQLLFAVSLLLMGHALHAQTVFINEFHYDNASTDVDEGIEIAGPAGTDLDCYQIVLYNGADDSLYSTINLSGTIPDQCNGFGTLWFPMALQNGPDGMALVFNPSLIGCGTAGVLSVVQFLHYEGGVIVAQDGPAAGMSSTPTGVSEPTNSPVGTSLQLTGNGTIGADFTWVAPATHTRGLINNGQTFGGPCAAIVPTQFVYTDLPSGCIQPGVPFSVTVCATNASGATAPTFASPVTISLASGAGVLSGTTTVAAVNGCVTFNNLSLNNTGPFSFSVTDGVLSTTSTLIYLSASCNNCPYMWRTLIDACDVLEGANEVLTFNSGDFFLDVTPGDIPISYGTTSPPATNYTTSLTSNLAYVAALNAAAGCPLFVDALSNSPIPPNTNFMIMHHSPTFPYNFSAYCGQGPYYIIFSSAAAWNTTGNFLNCGNCLGVPIDNGNGLTPRYFRSNFSALTGGAACDHLYEYTPCSNLLCQGNGDGLDWSPSVVFPDTNRPTSNWNSFTAGCLPLPATYSAALNAEWDGPQALLRWTTSNEVNCKEFVVERSVAGTDAYTPVAHVPAHGGLDRVTDYAIHDAPPAGLSLRYRLNQLDYNGDSRISNVVLLSPSGTLYWEVGQVGTDLLRLRASVPIVGGEIFDLQGRRLRDIPAFDGQVELRTEGLPEGTYIAILRSANRSIAKKFLLIGQ